MTFRTVIDALTEQSDALRVAVEAKKETLDAAEAVAVASAAVVVGKQPGAEANAATAAAKATEATNNATQVAAYKTAAAALNTTTTATAAVANLLPDMLAKKDPARHPFRKKMPTLVLDFERQKCHRYSPSTGFGETPLNTFMTFARNSTATYTGPDGLLKTAAANEPRYDYDPLTGECKGLLVEEQRTNLLNDSKFARRSMYWGEPRATGNLYTPNKVAPDGTLTAVEYAFAGDGVNQNCGTSLAAGGVAHTVSFWAKNTQNSAYVLNIRFGSADTAGTTISIPAQTGWGRYSCTYTPSAGDGVLRLYRGSANNLQPIQLWGVQFEVGAFPTSYIPSTDTFTGRASTATYLDANGVVQTAGVGVARSAAYDYDSDGVLRPIGLLLENSATNLLLYSEQFNNAAWTKNVGGVAAAPVVTANYGVAPDGQTTADRVVLALNAGTTLTDMSDISQGTTTVAGTTYTQSVWLKTTDASTKVLQLSFSGETPKLITVTGTWQRFSNTGVASDTIRGFRLALRGTTGTSYSADVLIWGAQQGVGSYPTSYIATTSAQVTRAADTSTSAQATRVADDAKVDGANFSNFYNQTQGTLVARGYTADSTAVGNSGTSRTLSQLSGGTDGVRVGMNNLCGYSVVSAGVEVAGSSSLGTWSSAQHALGIRIKKDDFAATRDGGTVSTDTSAATPRALKLQLGSNAAVDGWLNGHVSRISYYPQPFTNEELQAATSA